MVSHTFALFIPLLNTRGAPPQISRVVYLCSALSSPQFWPVISARVGFPRLSASSPPLWKSGGLSFHSFSPCQGLGILSRQLAGAFLRLTSCFRDHCPSFPEVLCHEIHCFLYFVGVVFACSTEEGKPIAVPSVLVRNTWQLETVHRVVPPPLLTTSSCSYFVSQCDISAPGKSFLDPICVKFCYVIIELSLLMVSIWHHNCLICLSPVLDFKLNKSQGRLFYLQILE